MAAVGPGTARALREVGVEPTLVPAGLVDVARRWSTRCPRPPSRPACCSPAATWRRPRSPTGCAPAGGRSTDVVAYRTVPAAPPPADVREAWTDGTIRAALLTSASTVRELAARLGPPPTSTLMIGIGPSTAAEAARLGLPLAGIATEQTMLGMVDALTRAVATVLPAPTPSPEEL